MSDTKRTHQPTPDLLGLTQIPASRQALRDLLEAAADQPNPTPRLARAVQQILALSNHPQRDTRVRQLELL